MLSLSDAEHDLVKRFTGRFGKRSLKILAPRFANTLCFPAHLRAMAHAYPNAKWPVEVRFIDWDDGREAEERIRKYRELKADVLAIYGSREWCMAEEQRIHEASGNPEAREDRMRPYRVGVTRFRPRYCFVPQAEAEQFGVRDFGGLIAALRERSTSVYTDHHSLAQALFHDIGESIEIVSGHEWYSLDAASFYNAEYSAEFNVFFVSAPATAQLLLAPDLVALDIPDDDERVAGDAFVTEVLILVGDAARKKAREIEESIAEYHQELFEAASRPENLQYTARAVASALSARFPQFAQISCNDPAAFATCLLEHHGRL